MSKADSRRSGSAKRAGLLSSFFGAREEGGERIDYVEDFDDPAEAPPPHPGARDTQQGTPTPPRDAPRKAAPGGGPNSDDAIDFDDVEIVDDGSSAFRPRPAGPAPSDGADDDRPGFGPTGFASNTRQQADIQQLREIDSSHLPGMHSTAPEEEVYTTGFSDVANARLWRRTKEARRRSQEKNRGYRDIFTPTRPKRRPEEFLGRRAVIGTVVEAIEEECAHVVLCGENGLGKTSLSNVVSAFAKGSGYLVARITGTEDLTFSHLIRSMFDELFEQIEQTPAGNVLWERLGVQDLNELLQDSSLDLVSEFLGEESLSVNRVIRALDKLSDNQAIVIIDDYEQIRSKDLKTKLAQVMKALSDQGGWLSFLILGRAESPSELLQDDIDSLPNAVGIYLDPFSLHEIEEVILEGARRISTPFTDDTIQAIARLSQGVPNVVQWLCFLAARRSVRRQGQAVEMEDLANIISDAVTKIDSKLRNQYDEVSRFDRGRHNADLLYLAVRAPCTTSGLFTAASMAMLSRQVIGTSWKESELHTALLPLCGKSKSAVLRKLETNDGIYYRFAHPTMRAVVMLNKIVRIPLLADSRTREVEETYLPSPENTPTGTHEDAPQGFDPNENRIARAASERKRAKDSSEQIIEMEQGEEEAARSTPDDGKSAE